MSKNPAQGKKTSVTPDAVARVMKAAPDPGAIPKGHYVGKLQRTLASQQTDHRDAAKKK